MLLIVWNFMFRSIHLLILFLDRNFFGVKMPQQKFGICLPGICNNVIFYSCFVVRLGTWVYAALTANWRINWRNFDFAKQQTMQPSSVSRKSSFQWTVKSFFCASRCCSLSFDWLKRKLLNVSDIMWKLLKKISLRTGNDGLNFDEPGSLAFK